MILKKNIEFQLYVSVRVCNVVHMEPGSIFHVQHTQQENMMVLHVHSGSYLAAIALTALHSGETIQPSNYSLLCKPPTQELEGSVGHMVNNGIIPIPPEYIHAEALNLIFQKKV